MLRIGPGAARAIEPVRLVHGEETARLLHDRHLAANGIGYRLQSTPPCRGSLVIADAYDIVFAHCALHGRRDAEWFRWIFPGLVHELKSEANEACSIKLTFSILNVENSRAKKSIEIEFSAG